MSTQITHEQEGRIQAVAASLEGVCRELSQKATHGRDITGLTPVLQKLRRHITLLARIMKQAVMGRPP